MGNNISYVEVDSDNGSVVEYDTRKNKMRIYHKSKSIFYKYFKCFYKRKLGEKYSNKSNDANVGNSNYKDTIYEFEMK